MSDSEDQNRDPVLLSSFLVSKKRCRVVFHRGTLTWEAEGTSNNPSSLSLDDVLGIHYIHNSNRFHCCGEASNTSEEMDKDQNKKTTMEPLASTSIPPGNMPQGHKSFTIHYAERGMKNKLCHKTIVFKHTDSRQIASWFKTFSNYINGLKERPQNLLLFVNPFGGKKDGLKIYEHKVKPMFEIANIKTTVIITERINHARDILLEYPFGSIDGIACIGGDGTFAEIFNGLLLRTAKDNNIDPNDPEAHIPTPQLRVGVIPGGSTDTMAYCFHGNIKVQTALLHIILGDSTGLDLCSVHSNAKLLRYYSSVISYGFLGDVIRDSEKFRWMGPKRYDYSGFKMFLSNKGYEGEVTVLADPSSAGEGPKCRENCVRCQSMTEILQSKDGDGKANVNMVDIPEQKTFKGKYFMVCGANVSCACIQSPNGLSPNCHLGDGCVDVLLIKHTNMVNNLRLLLALSSKNVNKSVFELPFVEVHRAREFSFRALTQNVSELAAPKLSVWNCDGEMQIEANIKIRVHCQQINVFTRRMPKQEETQPSCSLCPKFLSCSN